MKKEEILEQIFDKGYAETTIMLGEKIAVVINSLTAKNYLDIDSILGKKGTRLYVLQSYGIAKLAKALVTYNGRSFTSYEEKQEFLETLPAVVVDKLLVEQEKFEKEIKEILSPDNIEEGFFDKPGSVKNLEQLPKD